MQLRQFFAASRVVIVAGKGGVGKTTVTAALACAAADAGLRVLVVEVEGKSGFPAMFGAPPLAYDDAVLLTGRGPDRTGEVRARALAAETALVEYLDEHGMRRLSRRLASAGAIDLVATAVPGIEDILVLGKVKQLERAGVADLILLDAPAAGHAITFLQSARGLLDAVRVGPINTQARDVIELLSDPARCTTILVTLAEETPVNEVVDTAYALEDRVGIKLGPVVVNGLYPPVDGLTTDPAVAAAEAGVTLEPGEQALLGAAAAFRLGRTALQQEQVERLAALLPLPQLHLPFLFTAAIGLPEIESLAAAATQAVTLLPV